jgi:hypothetical protein
VATVFAEIHSDGASVIYVREDNETTGTIVLTINKGTAGHIVSGSVTLTDKAAGTHTYYVRLKNNGNSADALASTSVVTAGVA